MTEYTPSEQDMEDRYVGFSLDRMDFPNDDMREWAERLRGEFERGLTRVRRDAARDALGALADHSDSRDGEGVKGRLGGVIRTWRDTHYPEETP